MTYEETIDTIPAEADKAWNYEELRALWRQQRQRAETPPEELQTWDEAVLRLLKHNERNFYLDETTLAGVGAAVRGAAPEVGRGDPLGCGSGRRPRDGRDERVAAAHELVVHVGRVGDGDFLDERDPRRVGRDHGIVRPTAPGQPREEGGENPAAPHGLIGVTSRISSDAGGSFVAKT